MTNKKEMIGDRTVYYNGLSREAEQIIEKIKNEDYTFGEILQKKDNREVRLLLIGGKKYVLKKEKGRGIIDLILGSKARETLNNVASLKSKNFNNIYNVEIISETRSRFGVKETCMLTPYIEGREPETLEDYEEVMKILKELHSLGHYHGDSKPKNFVCTKNGIVLIDTKLTNTRLGLWKWKDIARLQKRTVEKLDLKKYFGDYKKNLGYYLGVAWVYKKELFRGIKIYEEVF